MPAASSSRPNHRKQKSTSSLASRPSATLPKAEVKINVYDLLPPGRLSSILWTIGGSLLHSGVVVNGKEYAYGGHNRRGVTGVYWTKPRFEPPGGTFRTEILHGFTFRTEQELDAIIKEVSEQFPGTSYNLLTNNCNHFTSALCEKLTSKPAPTWLNRAASIGLALPCMVPKEWISPPDCETAEGALVEGHDGGAHGAEDEDDEDEEEDGNDDEDEHAAMLGQERRRQRREAQRQHSYGAGSSRRTTGGSSFTEEEEDRGGEGEGRDGEDDTDGDSEFANSLAGGRRITTRDDATPPPRLVAVRDAGGRSLPVAERAPIPRHV